MFVYSGRCRLCETGLEAPFKDLGGNALHTGDIVLIYTERDGGVDMIGGMTAVVADQFTTFNNLNTGSHDHVLNSNPLTFFVMGIKSVQICEDGEWKVSLLKKFSDVLDGEHWKNFGFRYSNE